MKFSSKTKIIGYISDYTIGGLLGIANVYLLSISGKDKHRLKGLGYGHFAWATIYGVLSRFGATSMYPMSEEDNLNGLINHTVYGLVTTEMAVKLGDSALFKPRFKSLGNPTEENKYQANLQDVNNKESESTTISYH